MVISGVCAMLNEYKVFDLYLDENEKDIVQALRTANRSETEIYEYIKRNREIFKVDKKSNPSYNDEDYHSDLIKVMRSTPDAGLARARIQHYEHGRDPFNLPEKKQDKGMDFLINLVGWIVFSIILSVVLSIKGYETQSYVVPVVVFILGTLFSFFKEMR